MTGLERAGSLLRPSLAAAILCAAPALVWAQTNAKITSAAPATTVSPLAVAMVVKPSDWISRPTAEQIHALLPPETAQAGLHGTAVLQCEILPTTAVTGCVVVYDSDPTHAVGDLAIRASAMFRLSPRSANGSLVENQSVLIPVKFDIKVSRTRFTLDF